MAPLPRTSFSSFPVYSKAKKIPLSVFVQGYRSARMFVVGNLGISYLGRVVNDRGWQLAGLLHGLVVI